MAPSPPTPGTNLYERVMAGGRFAPPPPKVKASAAVILWRRRRSDGDLEVFWVRRSATMPFMPGWHAFPGGGVSRQDAELPADRIAGAPRGLEGGAISGAMPETLTRGIDPMPGDGVPGLVAATFRELFEETGLLPLAGQAPASGAGASPGGGPPPETLARARRSLAANESTFAELLGELGVQLDASRLVFSGRWLTPPFAPVRFDNRFFLLEHQPGEPEPGASPEADRSEWIRPAEALERWRAGEVIAAPPILHQLQVLAEEGPEAGLERLRRPEEANLGPLRKVEFRPGVLLFPMPTATLPPASHTNAYLLGHGDAVLVDPGVSLADRQGQADLLGDALEAAQDQLGLRLRAIWLTHHHPDHVGGATPLSRRFGVPVVAHPLTAERLRPYDVPVDETFEGGERVTLDGDTPMDLSVVHTPGHARGHLAFFETAQRSLLAGDMVATVSTIVVDPPEGDMTQYLDSLERLAELDPVTLFPGHGPVVVGAVAKLKEFIDHRLWREGRVLEAWKSGLREPEDFLPQVYDDAPRAAWPLATRQILAHLERLEALGALDADGAGGEVQ